MTKELENLARILRDPLSGLTWDNRIMAANAIDNLTAALEAQLAERVRVKSLVWRGTEGIWAKADALFGATYRITDYAGMAKPFKLETVGFVGPNGHYGTLDEAKAAAQADFERRILSALEATPPVLEGQQDNKPRAYIVHAPEDDYYGTGSDRLQFHPLAQYDIDKGYRQTPLYERSVHVG